MTSPVTDASHAQLASVVRERAGRLAAALMHVTGDFATAEDLVEDAVLDARAALAGVGDPGATGRVAVHRRTAPRPRCPAPRDQLPRQAGAAAVAGPARPGRTAAADRPCRPGTGAAAPVALEIRSGGLPAGLRGAVLVDEAGQDGRSADVVCGQVDEWRLGGLVGLGWVLIECLVRPVAVVVGRVLVEYASQWASLTMSVGREAPGGGFRRGVWAAPRFPDSRLM